MLGISSLELDFPGILIYPGPQHSTTNKFNFQALGSSTLLSNEMKMKQKKAMVTLSNRESNCVLQHKVRCNFVLL
jgi:hypothetical protein